MVRGPRCASIVMADSTPNRGVVRTEPRSTPSIAQHLIASPACLAVWHSLSRLPVFQVAVSWMRAVQAAGQGKEAEPPLSPICDHLPLQAWVEPCNTEPCPEGECGSRRSRVAEVTHIQRSALDPQRICVDGLWADWRDWEAQRPSSLGRS